jgi:ABC-type branched-subunit amino acid transport system ATPase component
MLQVRSVTKWYGDVKVLDLVSLNLNRGERAGLIGPNGCGTVQVSPSSVRIGYMAQALESAAGSI